MTEATSSDLITTDILVVGGGVAGFSLTALLAQAGLSVVCVDRAPLADRLDKSRDGRAQALSAASCRVLDAIGAWPLIAPHAAAIRDIAIMDADAPVTLNFLSREIGDHVFGYNVDLTAIRSALASCLSNLEGATILAPAHVVGFRHEEAWMIADLEQGGQIRTKLLAACDGRGSPLRQMAGFRVTEWPYNQKAIVCSIHHEHPLNGLALEHFFPEGPFAVLPLPDTEDGPCASVIWSTRPDLADDLMGMTADDFTRALAEKCGDRLGTVTPLPGRWCFPLTLHQAHRYIGPRFALVGDAAHAMHPIAGQGLNMGMRDVAALAEIIIERARLGLDIGDIIGLRRWQRWRFPDNTAYLGFTDGLNRLFSNNILPVAMARRAGLAMVERLPPVKHFFMRQAMGTGRGVGGRLPKIMQ